MPVLEQVQKSVNALSGLYLISTAGGRIRQGGRSHVSMPSRAYSSFLLLCADSGDSKENRVNALSGLFLISTEKAVM